MYGVINMPDEVQGAAPQVQQAYVMQQLSKWGPLTNQLGISDVIYPEMARIPNSAAYLVVMWPQYEAFALFPILGNIIKSAAVGTGLFFLGIGNGFLAFTREDSGGHFVSNQIAALGFFLIICGIYLISKQVKKLSKI